MPFVTKFLMNFSMKISIVRLHLKSDSLVTEIYFP